MSVSLFRILLKSNWHAILTATYSISDAAFTIKWSVSIQAAHCLGLSCDSAAKTCCFHRSVCRPLVTSALKRVLQAGSRFFLFGWRQIWTMAAPPRGFTLHWDARDHCVTSLSYIFAACSKIHIMSWCLCSVGFGCLAVSVSYAACQPVSLLSYRSACG